MAESGETGETRITELRVTANGRTLPEAPREPALTGSVRRGLKGAKAGKQVDARLNRLGVGWETFLQPKKRGFGRDTETIDVLRAIRDLDPQAAQAVWNYLRLLNPGHELIAMLPDGETPEEGPAQAYLDGLAARVGTEYGGGLDQLHNVLGLALLTSGAIAAEVAPTPGLDDVEDWYAVDPALLSFQRNPDSGVLELGQVRNDGIFVALPPAQVFYQPLDPEVGDPYGRPPMLASIQAVMSRAMMLNDVRAVAHQAGYPRIDVEVMWEAVQHAAPPQLKDAGRETDFAEWSAKQLNAIVTDYTSLQVDDTWIHYDWVKPSITPGSGLSFDFGALDAVLQRQLNSALKTLPIVLGINEGTSETHGSVQWQIQIAGVNALQRVIKRLIEHMAQVSLELAGYLAVAKIEYDETRTVDRLYEAQAELFEAQNLKFDVEMGWRDNDEAAEERTGHKAVAAPGDQMPKPPPPAPAEPAAGGNPVGDQGGQQPDQTEKQQAAEQAWALLWHTLGRSKVVPEPLRPAARAVALDGERLDELAEAYAEEGQTIFLQEIEKLLAALAGEGVYFRYAPSGELVDSAFGLGYRREMKRLLRIAIRQGMTEAGLLDEGAKVPERIVRRIWKQNDPYVRRIRDDLTAQVRAWQTAASSGSAPTLADVKAWFDANAYREAMMGKFLAKQGVAAGFTQGRTEMGVGKADRVFRWKLGPVKTEHCESCKARAEQCYTLTDLERIGYPGSVNLACMSNCKCSIQEEICGEAAAAPNGRAAARYALNDHSHSFQFPAGMAYLGDKDIDDWTEDEIEAFSRLNHTGKYRDQTPEEQGKGAACAVQKIDAAMIPEPGQSVVVDQKRKLTTDEAEALLAYQNDPAINERLRHGALDAADQELVDRIDAAVGTSTLRRRTVLTRYVDSPAFEGFSGEPTSWVGGWMEDPAFLSCSDTSGLTTPFSNRQFRLEISCPKGLNALDVDASAVRASFGSEGEVLLPRNTTLVIKGVRYDSAADQFVVKVAVWQ